VKLILLLFTNAAARLSVDAPRDRGGNGRVPSPLYSHTQEVPMPDEKKIDFEHEVGGFNPERREEKSKTQVGPAPTDDPRGKAAPDLKNKIDEKRTQVSPD
jgi:hypothetical protein